MPRGNDFNKNARAAVGLAFALILSACSALTPTSTPTAAPTATSALLATPTLSPTPTISVATPSETPAPAPTSATPSTSDTLDCRVLNQAFKNGLHVGPGTHFDMGWRVQNTGTAAWDPGTVEFAPFAGTRMYAWAPPRLQQTVASGDIVLLVADLIAPKSSGKYTTVWALKQGDQFFCRVQLTINVP